MKKEQSAILRTALHYAEIKRLTAMKPRLTMDNWAALLFATYSTRIPSKMKKWLRNEILKQSKEDQDEG